MNQHVSLHARSAPVARDPVTAHTEADIVAGLVRAIHDDPLEDVPELRFELLHLGLLRRDADDASVVYVTPEGRRLLRPGA